MNGMENRMGESLTMPFENGGNIVIQLSRIVNLTEVRGSND